MCVGNAGVMVYNRKRPAAEKTMSPTKDASMACLSAGVPGEPREKSDKAATGNVSVLALCRNRTPQAREAWD